MNYPKIRVAILADFPRSALGGVASGRGGGQGCTWLPQLAEGFHNYPNLEIHWLSFRRGGLKAERIRAWNQTFHLLPAAPFSVDLALNYLPARGVIAFTLRRIDPHVVHAWGTERIYPAALVDCKVPTILSMQGILSEYARVDSLGYGWRWRKMLSSESHFIRSASVVTSESEWGIDKVRALVPQADCRLVEYGVHPSFFDLVWKPLKEVPYVLFVGGSGYRKGFDVLIHALSLLPDRTWEVRLAGDADLPKACEASGLPGLRCLGLLSWPELHAQLQGAWCSVLPTRADTSPNSVKEARVVGLPVVTSCHGGQVGYIRDGENGLIVEPLDPRNLADALVHVMSSLETAKTMGACHHAKDREYLSPGRTAEGFARIYRELAGGAPV